jgi:hypothetical protein
MSAGLNDASGLRGEWEELNFGRFRARTAVVVVVVVVAVSA